jgi:Ti-type conjugative transfer relaxase TraA
MAIYHLSVKIISRSSGRSAVGAAAYRSASRLFEQSTGLWHDYSRKPDVVAKGIEAPAEAPEWVEDRSRLWNEVEATERRKDAQLAREMTLALPAELHLPEQEELLRGYLRAQFVRQGMVADYAIHHDNKDNPHAHVLLTMRKLSAEGFGKKETGWNARSQLMGWRQTWAEHSNRALALAGHDVAIDARSYEAQGLGLLPGIKIGVAPGREGRDGRDVLAERVAAQREVRRVNGAAILRDPTLATEAVTRQQATFTQAQMKRWLDGHTADAGQAEEAHRAVMALPTLVELSTNARGEARYTTQSMLDAERRLIGHAQALQVFRNHAGGEAPPYLAANHGLNEEQHAALRHVTGPGHIAVLQGYAGTGKSQLLGAARQYWEGQGYRVKGAALAGIAAEGLGVASGIPSRTLASLEARLASKEESFTRRDVLVIDEAGMVGTRQLERVLGQVRQAGAKAVLVGDTAQLQAIEAGAPLRAVTQEVGAAQLTGVRRQTEVWQQQASVQLAEGRTSEALKAYRDHGQVHAHGTQEEAMWAMLAAWDRGRQEAPDKSQAMLAYRRQDVAELNDRAHALRHSAGELGREREVETERGPRAFAAGERLVFLRNDRALGVHNGITGTLEQWSDQGLQVRLDGPEQKRVVVDLDRYNHLDYGYASTVHKAQGATVDRAHVLASPGFDRHVSYVAMTRHKEQLRLHYSREAFGSDRQLAQLMGRERSQETALEAEGAENGSTTQGPNRPGVRPERSSSMGQQESHETVETSQDPLFVKKKDGQTRIEDHGSARNPPSNPAPDQTYRAREDAAKPAMTPEQALDYVPAVRAQQNEVDNARRRLAYYDHQGETHRRQHPILSRLPGSSPDVTDLRTGKMEKLSQVVAKEQRAFEQAEAKLDALRKHPEIQHQARYIASEHGRSRDGFTGQYKGRKVEIEKTQQRSVSRTHEEAKDVRDRNSSQNHHLARQYEHKNEQAVER